MVFSWIIFPKFRSIVWLLILKNVQKKKLIKPI